MTGSTSFPARAIRATKDRVESFAEELAKQVNFNPGDDIEDLVRRAGGELVVGSSGHGDAESGSIVVRAMDDFTIYLSQHTSSKRDRFTIAHELGHLLLHFKPLLKEHPGATMRATRYVDEGDSEQQRAEWEANWFAAGFLMPRNEFTKAYQDNPRFAADMFKVSLSAAKIRAKSLNLP